MSGVIDEDGVQWERCNRCAGFTRFENLCYEEPTDEFRFGRDLCEDCVNAMLNGGPTILPTDQLRDQLSQEESERIHREVEENIDKFGLKVFVYNADGTVTDESIPPKG